MEAEFEESPTDLNKIKQLIGENNIQFEETKVKFETPRPMESLAMLNRNGIHLKSLKIQNANLEDVFLNLTGRRLRD